MTWDKKPKKGHGPTHFGTRQSGPDTRQPRHVSMIQTLQLSLINAQDSDNNPKTLNSGL